jgi:hypothetical protein
MKFIILLLMLPGFAIAQKQKVKGYAKFGGGLMFGKDQDESPAGFLALGARAGNYFLVGVGGGIFKPTGFKSTVFNVGADINITDMKAKVSPIVNIGLYKPISNEQNVTTKLYATGGVGMWLRGPKQKGGAIMFHVAQFKYDYKLYGVVENMDHRILMASFYIII